MRHALPNRREFLADVGRSMLIAGIGYSAARDLGMTVAWADDGSPERLLFGAREGLVSMMQETPPDRMLPQLVDLIRAGTDLRELVAAGALANARAFGGEDYVGFHTFMAMMPALRMADALPSERRALPVLKVLYRNASRLQEAGKSSSDTLQPIDPPAAAAPGQLDAIREAVHRRDALAAERALAAAAGVSLDCAWNDLLPTVQEAPEVHRIVLAHRAWDMVHLVGLEHAATMLRQSVRFCVKGEEPRQKYSSEVPALLTELLDQHKLAGRQPGTRPANDAWIESMVSTLLSTEADQGAGAVAAALAEGFSPESLSEAISLAANSLVLRDEGRPEPWAQPNKPVGSVHGDSIGVHASDSANAWRHIAAVSNPLNAFASLILAGYHVARDRSRHPDYVDGPARPLPEHLERVTSRDPERLLSEIDGAIREKDQERVCAAVHRYLELGHSERPVMQMLLRYATSEDGALHAEKYYWTVSDEYALTRPAFRNRQIVGLARVTASEYGYPAPGYQEACGLLGCEA